MCSAHNYLSKGCCKRRFVCPTQADARKIALSWRRRSKRRCSASLRRGRPRHSTEPGGGRSAALGAPVHFGTCTSSFTCSRSEEHTSELQSHVNLVCRLLLEKKKKKKYSHSHDKKKKTKQN